MVGIEPGSVASKEEPVPLYYHFGPLKTFLVICNVFTLMYHVSGMGSQAGSVSSLKKQVGEPGGKERKGTGNEDNKGRQLTPGCTMRSWDHKVQHHNFLAQNCSLLEKKKKDKSPM